MAVGDYMIRRNASETDTITTTPTTFGWDTEVKTVGSDITYSSDVFTLVTAGKYLIIWNEYIEETLKTTSGGDRITIQGRLYDGTNELVVGACQLYIRLNTGQFESVMRGACIHTTSSSNETIEVRMYRTDNSGRTAQRLGGYGGVQIIRIDETDNFGIYSNTGTQVLTGDSEVDMVLNNNVEEDDPPFNRTSNDIDIDTTGQYIVCYSAECIIDSGTGRSEIYMACDLNDVEVVGSRSQCYMRGSDNSLAGAISHIFMLDVGTAGHDLTWRVAGVENGTNLTIEADATIQIWQLPTGHETVIVEATTGSLSPAATTRFTWDTLPHIDTAAFTHTAGNQNIDVDAAISTYLAFATYGRTSYQASSRTTPIIQLETSGGVVSYGADASYARGSGTAGHPAAGAACILPDVPSGSIYAVTTDVSTTNNACDNQSGQFAILDLGGLYTYTYPPVITDVEDEVFDVGESDVDIDGQDFESTQGTGKVELGNVANYATATLVTQTVNSWGDTDINIDLVQGALEEGTLYLFVTNDSGETSPGYQVQVGESTYHSNVEALSPDHFWRFNNAYTDEIQGNDADNVQSGSPSFDTTLLCRSATHCLLINAASEHTRPADSNDMNLQTETRRVMGGWIRVSTIFQQLTCVYEEGAQINNFCIIMGMGNKILAQAVDDGGFNIQVYGDFALAANRNYHVCFLFSGSGFDNIFRFYIDGVEQSRSFGNPPGLSTFPGHSGDIAFGGTDTTLEVGGTDITFASTQDCRFACWATWADAAVITPTQIKEDLFEDGARWDTLLSDATESSMQTTIETNDDSTWPDQPLVYKINEPTDESNPTFTLTNQVFVDRVSLHVRWMGSGTLSLRASGTTNLDSTKMSTPNGGTVTIIDTAGLTFTVRDIVTNALIQNARVYVTADSGGPLPSDTSTSMTRSTTTLTCTDTAHGMRTGDEIIVDNSSEPLWEGRHTITVTGANTYTYTVANSGSASGSAEVTAIVVDALTNASGVVTAEIDYTSDQPVVGYVRKGSASPYYKQSPISATVASTGLSTTVLLISDE